MAARPDRLAPDFSARKARAGAGPGLGHGPGASGRTRRERRAQRPLLERRNRLAAQLTLVAAIWSFGLIIAAVALPTYQTTTTTNADGTTFITTTLVSGDGAWVLIPVAVPLVITGVVALALRRKRAGAPGRHGQIAWAAVALLGAFALLSILSIGAFVIPAVLLLARATQLTRPAPAH